MSRIRHAGVVVVGGGGGGRAGAASWQGERLRATAHLCTDVARSSPLSPPRVGVNSPPRVCAPPAVLAAVVSFSPVRMGPLSVSSSRPCSPICPSSRPCSPLCPSSCPCSPPPDLRPQLPPARHNSLDATEQSPEFTIHRHISRPRSKHKPNDELFCTYAHPVSYPEGTRSKNVLCYALWFTPCALLLGPKACPFH